MPAWWLTLYSNSCYRNSIFSLTLVKRIGINLAGRTAIGKSAEGYYRHQLYIYSSDGTRIGKTVNGRTKNYLWDGGKLLSQTFANDTQVFLYHGDSRVALEFMGQLYYYVYNLQGDVVGLVDKTGTTMVTYKYDVWGKPESTTGPMATTLGVANPFRYRGYYYDTESGFYYLQSRYYDPEVGRFLNADAYLNSGHMLGTNAYVYCYNNPVMYADYTGCIPEWLYAVAAAAAAADGPLPFGDSSSGGRLCGWSSFRFIRPPSNRGSGKAFDGDHSVSDTTQKG